MKRIHLTFLVLAVASQLSGAAEKLTYVDLVNRITDLQRLASLPVQGDSCAQWSSYDRKSRYDQQTGTYLNWDANGDGDGIIRKEGEDLVMAEMRGPGCIWRIWSATPQKGRVRIYLDGAREPAIDLPFQGYFDGKNSPFTRKALVHTVAKGWNNYTPIPYQKSCKIVAEKGWGAYYHFVYETFPPGTEVPPFSRQFSTADEEALDRANSVLASCGPDVEKSDGPPVVQRTLEIGPQQVGGIGLISGPAAITQIRARLDPPPAHSDFDPLRELCLQINWDGEAQPSVWVPLGDFFGTAVGMNPYRSYPLGVTDDGWCYCKWYMPFAKEASVQLVNDGNTKRRVSFEVSYAPLTRPIEQLGRFHAKWHRDALLPNEPERRIDWPIVKTTGVGRFVGVMLHIWNPRGGWWGEGDEKFFVDGEKFPSTFGTGSEDYFGYAWSDAGLFQHAFHNQTRNDGNSRGHVSVNRWHISDNVPFQSNFEGCIEKYYPNQRPTLYAATAYWYLSADGKDPYLAVPLNQRIGYWVPVENVKVKGAIEGEALKVLSKTGGDPQEQDMTGFGDSWSNDAHLWWINTKPGDRLDLALPVLESGNYQISAQLTKAPDYAIVQLFLDGEKLGQRLDLYHPSVIATGLLLLDKRKLAAGQHKFSLEIIGANPKAITNYMAGLDYLKLEPIK